MTMFMLKLMAKHSRQFYKKHIDDASKIIAAGPEANPEAYADAILWRQQAEDGLVEFEQWLQEEEKKPNFTYKKSKKFKKTKKGGHA